MKFTCLPFWGVPCCERFFRPQLQNALHRSSLLDHAQSPSQAELLIVFGKVTHKQAPYLQNLWADFVFPAYSLHFSGCGKIQSNYALVHDLSEIVKLDFVVDNCSLSRTFVDDALETLKAQGNLRKR